MLLGFLAVSMMRASISTCLVGVSRRATSSSRIFISFSVATTISWLVRTSAITLLRLSRRTAVALVARLVALEYFNWMILVPSGSGAAGSLMVMRTILDFGSSIIVRL